MLTPQVCYCMEEPNRLLLEGTRPPRIETVPSACHVVEAPAICTH